MTRHSDIEREFGVPIPGKVLDPSKWTKTALKKLPPEGPLDVKTLFGRSAPLIVDLGCGNGRFLLGSALARPDFDHIGIDILPMALRYATRRGNQRGLCNLRFAAIDAQRFVSRFLPQGSVLEFHCYHPQPHHDLADAGKRLIAPRFLADAVHALEAGGLFVVQTDNEPYWRYIQSIAGSFFEFREQAGPWPDAPQGRSRREILARRRGYPVYRGWGIRKELTTEELERLALSLAQPTFDAGPRHSELDRLE
jgi:tRNA (guanine-N7-)-methyltransferase